MKSLLLAFSILLFSVTTPAFEREGHGGGPLQSEFHMARMRLLKLLPEISDIQIWISDSGSRRSLGSLGQLTGLSWKHQWQTMTLEFDSTSEASLFLENGDPSWLAIDPIADKIVFRSQVYYEKEKRLNPDIIFRQFVRAVYGYYGAPEAGSGIYEFLADKTLEALRRNGRSGEQHWIYKQP